ncbi:MAG: hypothetical protein Q4B59_02865 [Lachnospiraceae bacterium]|nr:hypothetical protein [Lachnospiraceae bacterium]
MKKNKKTGSKPQSKKTPAMPGSWYYMAQEVVTLEQLKGCVDEAGYEVEYWEDAGVLEITAGEKCSVDVEAETGGLEDEFSQAYLAEHQVQSVYYVSLPADRFEECRPVLECILEKTGGMLCADSEDFTPVLKG